MASTAVSVASASHCSSELGPDETAAGAPDTGASVTRPVCPAAEQDAIVSAADRHSERPSELLSRNERPMSQSRSAAAVDLEAQVSEAARGESNLMIPRDKLQRLVEILLVESTKIIRESVSGADDRKSESSNIDVTAHDDRSYIASAGSKDEAEDEAEDEKHSKVWAVMKVEVMSEEDIAKEAADAVAEAEALSFMKDSRSDPSRFDYWNHFLQDESLALDHLYDASAIQNYYRNSPEARLSAQKQLLVALYRLSYLRYLESEIVEQRDREYAAYALGLLVSLIGIRAMSREYVPGLVSSHIGRQDDTVIKILIAILGMPSNPTVAEVLARCYSRRLLEQPLDGDSRAYKVQVQIILLALDLLNLKFRSRSGQDSVAEMFRSIDCFGEDPETPMWSSDVLSTRISRLLVSSPSSWFSHSLAKAEGPTFRTQDMSVHALHRVGGIEIEWTEYMEDHLLLTPKTRVLKMHWLMTALECNRFFQSYFSDDSFQLVRELEATYRLLFPWSPKAPSEYYKFLPVPPVLKYVIAAHRGQDRKGKLDTLSDVINKRHPNPLPIDVCQFLYLGRHEPDVLPFSDFPHFGERLRELKTYMDAHKPKGIRGLWRDKRDSLQWYTFWAVIIVGSLSLLLAFFSLGVSTAQTVAAFKALDRGRD